MISSIYGPWTPITITAENLGCNCEFHQPVSLAREANFINNILNLYIDYKLSCVVTTYKKASGCCHILLSSGSGTNIVSYPATGKDSIINLNSLSSLDNLNRGERLKSTDLLYLGKLIMSNKETIRTDSIIFPSVAEAFGGYVPPKWAPILVNCTGQRIVNAKLDYLGVNYSSIDSTTNGGPNKAEPKSMERKIEVISKSKRVIKFEGE